MKKYEHTWVEDCGDPNCNGACVLCSLSVCSVCGGYEGGLPTHCPGSTFSHDQYDVYGGKWDFRYGRWMKGIISRGLLWDYEEAIEVERKSLAELLKEPVCRLTEIKDNRKHLEIWKEIKKEHIKRKAGFSQNM